MEEKRIFQRIQELSDEISSFRFPSPEDEFTEAYALGYKNLATKLIYYARQINDPEIQEIIKNIDPEIDTQFIYEAYELAIKMDLLLEVIQSIDLTNIDERASNNSNISKEIMEKLGEPDNQNIDLKQKLIALGEEIVSFYWNADNPYEDDPYIMETDALQFFNLARRFILFANRIDDTEFKSLLEEIEIDLSKSNQKLAQIKIGIALEIIQEKEHIKVKTEYKNSQKKYISEDTLNHLRKIENHDFDLSKLIKICKEINDAYVSENWISISLLIKTLINHIPPIFGHTTFKQVVSNASRSTKKQLENLENFARPTADKHTHELIRPKEILPTIAQVEPFSSSIELLLQEIIIKLHSNE